jgi:hypothetical protein
MNERGEARRRLDQALPKGRRLELRRHIAQAKLRAERRRNVLDQTIRNLLVDPVVGSCLYRRPLSDWTLHWIRLEFSRLWAAE